MKRTHDEDPLINDIDNGNLDEDFEEEESTKGQIIPAFLTKTFAIMHNPQYEHIVHWNDAGDAILIEKVEDFSQTVLPKYFKHGNFASFVRQLNMYGFHKTRQDPNWREFQHPMFKKGRVDLLAHIKRKTGIGKQKTNTALENTEIEVKKGRVDTDRCIKDYNSLRKKQEEIEMKYNKILQDNSMLYNIILDNKQKQDDMKKQMEKIYSFVYNIYTMMHPQLTNTKPKMFLMNNNSYTVSNPESALAIPNSFNNNNTNPMYNYSNSTMMGNNMYPTMNANAMNTISKQFNELFSSSNISSMMSNNGGNISSNATTNTASSPTSLLPLSPSNSLTKTPSYSNNTLTNSYMNNAGNNYLPNTMNSRDTVSSLITMSPVNKKPKLEPSYSNNDVQYSYNYDYDNNMLYPSGSNLSVNSPGSTSNTASSFTPMMNSQLNENTTMNDTNLLTDMNPLPSTTETLSTLNPMNSTGINDISTTTNMNNPPLLTPSNSYTIGSSFMNNGNPPFLTSNSNDNNYLSFDYDNIPSMEPSTLNGDMHSNLINDISEVAVNTNQLQKQLNTLQSHLSNHFSSMSNINPDLVNTYLNNNTNPSISQNSSIPSMSLPSPVLNPSTSYTVNSTPFTSTPQLHTINSINSAISNNMSLINTNNNTTSVSTPSTSALPAIMNNKLAIVPTSIKDSRTTNTFSSENSVSSTTGTPSQVSIDKISENN